MIVWEPSYEGLHEPHSQKILKHIIISSSSSYTYLTSSASSFVPTITTRSTWIANIVYAVIMLLVAMTRTPAVSAAGLPSSSSLHQVVDKSETHLLAKSIEIQCPVSNSCPCHKYEDGLFLNCDGTTSTSLRSILENITSPIHTLSIYDFDRSVTSLSQDVFQAVGINIRILTFTHSHLETLKDNSLRNLRASLESLSIANGKLVQIPTKSLAGLSKLTDLYFDYNEITRIDDYSFFGLRLSKLSMKGNKLREVPEHSFSGLEKSLQDVDLSENQLKIFPMWSLKLLENLRVLRLSINRISTFDSNRTVNLYRNYQLHALGLLDLSSNNFMAIQEDSLRPFPSLKTLSLYSNQITSVHKNSFKFLKDLVSLDMSHNRIIYLDSSLFERNKRLKTIDLSHNHIHSINGVFCNLPKLHEIFLSENNILELSSDAFTNSTGLDVIYLESNAIRHIDPMSFSTLTNLTQLHLRSNFISLIPVTLFDKSLKLISISLDDNEIVNLEIGMFRKLSNLREVRLHNNRIREIKNGVFHPLPKLIELQIQNNQIEIIEQGSFSSLKNLQELNIQNNKLIGLDEILPNTPNASLQILQLNQNNIVEIHLKSFQNLENITILRLNDNKLRKIDKSLLVDMKKLEKIYLSHNEITEIEKDAFTTIRYLRHLDLSRNRLKHIRREFFVNLVELEELIIAENYIDTIDSFSFRALKKLKVLDLSGNRLVSITKDIFQFQNDLSSLTQLNLRNCSLQRIELNSFKSLINLNDINLEENQLKPMDVQSLDIPSLHSLKLSSNDFLGGGNSVLLNGMFDKLRSLQQLTLANCNITHLPEILFQKNTNLVRLDLRDNHFTELVRGIFSGLNVFKELRLCRNNLTEFPHIALYNISTLEYLTLSGNYLTAIDFFKLSGTLNLRHLDLKDNRISLLQGFNAVNLTQLDYIDLSGNSLASLPRNFLQHSINLQRVDLSENHFRQIPSSVLSDTSLPRLQWLNLTGNPIDTIYTVKEERYPFLKELYLCGTSLTILTSKDFEAFQALQHLHLIKNRINRISPGAFKSLANLLTLDVSVNELEKLPKERLQGLKSLRLLNISHNSLRDLEEFSNDLEQLQICDLSYNQLDNIDTKVFHNLKGMIELHLVGNRLTVIYSDAFRYLSKLQILDLRKNYFEVVPLEALKPLETNVRTLKIEENPLHCSCETQQLWEWLRDHRKWTTDDNVNYLRCEQPDELRGKIFSEMEPQQFCDAPLIPKIAIQDIQPFSVVVSWQNQQNFGLLGYEVLYHELDGEGKESSHVRGKRLNSTAYSAKLYNLTTNTRYHICVIGIGNWIPEHVLNALNRLHSNKESADERRNKRLQEQQDQHLTDSQLPYQMNQSPLVLRDDYSTGYLSPSSSSSSAMYALPEDDDNYIEIDSLLDVLRNSHSSKCTDVQTLDPDPSQLIETNGLSSHSFLQSLLTRRLGLIVGACLGIVVFIILASMLSYYKMKRQRLENLKRQQNPQTMSMPMPPEYISYRHFSIPSDAIHSTSTSSSVIGLANGPNKVITSSLKTPSPICEKITPMNSPAMGNGNGVAIISNNDGVVDNSDTNNHQHHHLHNHHNVQQQQQIQQLHMQQIQQQQLQQQQQQIQQQQQQQQIQQQQQQQQIQQQQHHPHQIPHHHSNYMSGVVLGTNNLTAC